VPSRLNQRHDDMEAGKSAKNNSTMVGPIASVQLVIE
jgi:hypothetical protein